MHPASKAAATNQLSSSRQRQHKWSSARTSKQSYALMLICSKECRQGLPENAGRAGGSGAVTPEADRAELAARTGPAAVYQQSAGPQCWRLIGYPGRRHWRPASGERMSAAAAGWRRQRRQRQRPRQLLEDPAAAQNDQLNDLAAAAASIGSGGPGRTLASGGSFNPHVSTVAETTAPAARCGLLPATAQAGYQSGAYQELAEKEAGRDGDLGWGQGGRRLFPAGGSSDYSLQQRQIGASDRMRIPISPGRLALRPELVVNCEPLLREASGQEQVDEILQHLEENDENFHKYELVKALRQRLNQVIEPLIDEEEQMLRRQSALDCASALKSQVTSRVDLMLKNFDEEFSNRQSLQSEASMGYAAKQSFSWSDVDSNFSSLNHNQPDFHEQSSSSARSVRAWTGRREISVRLEAMSKLWPDSAINQSYDSWLILEAPLLDALCDSDETLSGLALRFSVKGIRRHRRRNVRDISPAIAAARAAAPRPATLSEGLVVNDAARLIRAFRLLNEFQQRISPILLSAGVRPQQQQQQQQQQADATAATGAEWPPDPDALPGAAGHRAAVWLTKWLHGSYSREPLLGLLAQRKYLWRLCRRRACALPALPAGCRVRRLRTGRHAGSAGAGGRERPARAPDAAPDEPGGRRGRPLGYTGAQLDYLHFVHCLLLVTRLMHYCRGRAMFPVPHGNSQVTCSKFVVAMVKFLQTYKRQPVGKKGLMEPSALVKDALIRLASNSHSCAACLCNDEVAAALLQPLIDLMKASDRRQRRPRRRFRRGRRRRHSKRRRCDQRHGRHRARMRFLLQSSADSTKAASAVKPQPFHRQPPAHLVAQLTKRALKKAVSLSRSASLTLLHACRQLYSTPPDGLHSLRPFRLHELAAQAWREAQSDPGFDTARGVLLLQQTGAMADCTARMCARYVRKQQVGKCQRFGYGHMLAQLVGTARGFRHVADAGGFVPALLHTVWAAIECGTDDRLAATPRPWPIEAVDPPRSRWPLTGLCRLLSAFPAVCECFADRPLPSKVAYSLREVRADLPALFDRLVLLDRPAKLSSLFHPSSPPCSAFGCSAAQAQFLDNSADGDADETEPDTGSSGRRLVLDADSDYPYEMCQRLPPPPSYFVRSRDGQRGGKPDPVQRFAESSPETGLAWLAQGRSVLLQELTAGGTCPCQVSSGAEVWGDEAEVWGDGAEVYGDKAEVWGDEAEVWGDEAEVKQQKKAGFLPTEPAGPDAAAAVTADATSASRTDELGIRLMV
uniref:Magnesium transporter n=1 Tax=Macrostomum lignano TaxID=282301 RepID=A0A1I8JNZ5_9PLAT